MSKKYFADRRLFLCALFTLVPWTAFADSYSLGDGHVTFDAPAQWQVIMQKTDGDPQFFAFQVTDPDPHHAENLTRVSVTTHRADSVQDFKQMVDDNLKRASQLPGYRTEDTHADPSSLHYSVRLNGQTMAYRDSYFFKNGLAVQLRCVRPVVEDADPVWVKRYQQACDALADDLRQ